MEIKRFMVSMEFDSAVYVEVEAENEMSAQVRAAQVFCEHFGDYVSDIEAGSWFAGEAEEMEAVEA